MAEEQKSQKLVETNKAVSAGIASVVVAALTSKLGVAGTLIGTGLAAMLITLGAAVLKAQFEKASSTIAGLPSTVQGRLSTQQIRMPGKQSPEPNPEPGEKRGRISVLLSRLRAMPGFLRELPSNQKRRVLLAGVLAGLVAVFIGLSAITGIELVSGENLSCMVWSECSEEDADSSGSSRGSGLSILGGYSGSGTRSTPPVEQKVAPGSDQKVSPQRPAQPGSGGETPQQPGGAPKQGANPSPPPGEDVEPSPPPPNKAPEKEQGSQDGQQKEDRGYPDPL